MNQNIDRRCFLKTTSAAGAAAYSCLFARVDGQTSKSASVRIGMASYPQVGDYPIRPKAGAGVRIKDRFWGPKIRTNAEVTIPFETQKLGQSERRFGVNVLEAAIMSLQTHPDPALASASGATNPRAGVASLAGQLQFRSRGGLLSRDRQTRLAGSGYQDGRRALRKLQSQQSPVFGGRTRRHQLRRSSIGRRETRSISIWRSTISTSAASRTPSIAAGTTSPTSRCWNRARRSAMR